MEKQLSREEILAMTMEQFEQKLPGWKERIRELQTSRLVLLCEIGGHRCSYLEKGNLLQNEKEFASKMLLRKTSVGEVLNNWMHIVQYDDCYHPEVRNEQIASMREFMNVLCYGLGFPYDLDDDNSEYNKILDSFDNARNVARQSDTVSFQHVS